MIPEETWDLSRSYQEFSTPNELKMLDRIRSQTCVLFDMENKDHSMLLVRLWKAALPGEALPDLDKPHERWKYIGFQNARPETDFRAAGWLGLRHLVLFAEKYPKLLHRILAEQRYPWAAASINITEIIVTHLKLRVPQPRIAPIPLDKIYDLQAFMWLSFPAYKEGDKKDFAEFRAVDALYLHGVMTLDHLWNQRLERDRSTNLLHFKLALIEASAVMHHVLHRRPENIEAMNASFMGRLPPLYETYTRTSAQSKEIGPNFLDGSDSNAEM